MATGIKVITGANAKIKDVIEQYKQGRLSTSLQGVQPTFGMGIGGYTGSSDLIELKQKLDKMGDIFKRYYEDIRCLRG